MPCGDYNCTNDTAYLMNSYNNYWVLHVTDTVDYTTWQVPEWPMPLDEAILVYPNPTNGTVTIGSLGVAEVKVYNVLGQLVNTVQGTNEINISNLKQGVYFVSIITENKERFIRKIVKN